MLYNVLSVNVNLKYFILLDFDSYCLSKKMHSKMLRFLNSLSAYYLLVYLPNITSSMLISEGEIPGILDA